MTLHLARSNRDVALRLTKWFGAAANPLRHERHLASVLEGVEYAGYTQRVTLQSIDQARRVAGGRRHLEPASTSARRRDARAALQRRDAAEVLRPDSGREHDDRGASAAGEDRLQRLAQDRAQGGLDLRPRRIRLRPGRSLRRWSSAISSSTRRASTSTCSGTIPTITATRSRCAASTNRQYGSFCELEYHAPAIGAYPDPTQTVDTSKSWSPSIWLGREKH